MAVMLATSCTIKQQNVDEKKTKNLIFISLYANSSEYL